jgi:hypothetical protein
MDVNNVAMCELHSSGSSQGQIPDSREYGNKNSVSWKVRNFFTSQSNFRFLNVTQHGVYHIVTSDILGWYYFPLKFPFQILMH